MNIKICTPRIFTCTVLSLLLLSSTCIFAQSNAGDTNSSAAAQWKPGVAQVQLEGRLEIIYQDFRDGHSHLLYTLEQADGTRVPLQFVTQPPTHLLTGTRVYVNGQRSGGGLVLYSGSNVKNTGGGSTSGGTTTPSNPVPNSFGSQSVLVILVNFQDAAVEPYTISDAQNAFFTTTNNFFIENSYGQTSLDGTVVGWFTIPDSVTACNLSQIATDAQNAATASGVTLSNYTRYAYVFPYNSACGWAGASNVGGNPSESWINGTLDPHVLSHELGHAFGLWHSHSLDCGTTATICPSGTVAEYGDRLDVMGTVQTAIPDYNAFQKERLGWLNYAASPSIQTVTASGTYTINPYELGGPGPNGIKILKSTDPTTGAKTWYYLEARQAIGFDSFLSNSIYYTQNETAGVLFHLGTDGNGNSSQVLDMTPATPTSQGWFDISLVSGQNFQDSTAGVTVTPTVVSGTGATVQITMNGSSCTPANPTVTVSQSLSQAVTSGTPLNFIVAVTDNDSSGCAAATFNLASTVPSGWAGLWNVTGLTLSPGKSGSATLTVTSPAGTSDGSYNIGVSASNASTNSYAGSTTATYVINTAPLSISASATPSTTSAGQTVGVTVTLLSGTTPDAGASVSVSVMSPSGRTQTMNGTTASNGIASFAYKLSRHAAPGIYQVQATVGSSTKAAATAGTTTSFTVQ